MIVMTPQASKSDIDAVTKRLETTGVHVVVMPGELTTAIGAIGDPEGVGQLPGMCIAEAAALVAAADRFKSFEAGRDA